MTTSNVLEADFLNEAFSFVIGGVGSVGSLNNFLEATGADICDDCSPVLNGARKASSQERVSPSEIGFVCASGIANSFASFHLAISVRIWKYAASIG